MKNRGFTLVEMLGVIIIIAVIIFLVLPSVSNIIKNSKETVYQKKVNEILNASYDWALNNVSILPEKNKSIYITLSELKKQGFVDPDIKDPKTKKYFPDNLVVTITNTKKTASNKYEKKGGDYLFVLNINELTSDIYIENKPSIELIGLTQDSSGNYVTKINIGKQFENVSYIATSSLEEDLTSRVIVNIIKDDIAVEKVDTTSFGIYYINYTVVDNYGYSNTVTLSVIVTDEEAPVLTIPENITLGTNISSYNLSNGASCTDNSGKCDITISGSVEYGKIGKYLIEYIATDPSGNRVTENRVITIE